MSAASRLTQEPFQPDEELACFIDGLDGDGAVVSFTGLARPTGVEGRPVATLFLDVYPGMTEASIEGIARDALERFPVSAVSVVHRCGDIAPGEPIVFAAAAAPHRRAAFEAADYLMDRLKTDAAFWKREESAEETTWIEPTAFDRADRARWNG